MRVKGILVLLILALMLAVPHFALAVNPVHNFDCKKCHLSGLTINQIGGANVCLTCHGATPATTTTNLRGDATSGAGFVTGDASNHYGNNVNVAAATSHNWAATSVNPAAGAKEPVRSLHPGFFSRYGTTVGKVACSRCHQPHGDMDINPKLLTTTAYGFTATPMAPNAMCIACHQDFAGAMSAPGNHGLLTHPLIDNYPAFQTTNNTKYKAVTATYNAATPYATGVQLVGGAITCVTCHGLHATDSNAGTADGFASVTLGTGDGLMLRGSGSQFTVTVSADESANGTYPTGTSICTECHNYDSATHSGDHGAVGCLACHGGHEYNGGVPNIYMLNDPTGSYAIDPANIATLDKSLAWAGNTPGVIDGFCENCHGNVESNWDTVRNHSANIGEDCTTCHQNHGAGAFSEPLGCDGCHGSPPSANAPGNAAFGVGYDPNGFAWVSPTHSYNSSIVVKDESLTPHSTHSGTTSRYSYTCSVCHNTHLDDFAGTHNIGNSSFQDVLEAGHPYDAKAVAAGGVNPSYVDASGTCNTVYCHSNGGVNDGLGSRTFTFKAPTWAGTKGTIVGLGTECSSCHGNASGAMGSATHDKHIAAAGHAYGCNVCHVSTATSSTDLVGLPATPPSTHVNKTVNVAFDSATAIKAGGAVVAHGATPYSDATAMTCSAVYCHSTGQSNLASRTYKTISWTTAGPLGCTACHNIPSASQTTAHQAHVVGSGSNVGRDLECAVCHDDTMDTGSNIALGTGGLTFHVNGTVDVKLPVGLDAAQDCGTALCHSNGNFDSVQIGDQGVQFNVAAWTLADTTPGTLSDCVDCHGDGATKSYPAYPNKGTTATPTGDSNSHETHVGGGISCAECHSSTTSNGTSITGTTHVNQNVEVGGTKIVSYTVATETCSATACHGSGTPQWGGVVVCGSCHAANNTLADSHSAHYNVATAGKYNVATIGSTAGDYVFDCGVCHSSTSGSSPITHGGGAAITGNAVAEVNFDGTVAEGTAVYNNGAVLGTDPNGFAYTAATCASLYCHGNFGGNGNVATPTWGTAASGACGTCHDVDSSPTMSGGVHNTHVKTIGLTCDYCHAGTAVNAAGGIVSRTLHANQLLNWDLDETKNQLTATSTYSGSNVGTIAKADVGSLPYGNCNNIYCHSDVQASPPNGTTGVTYNSANWNGTVNCGDCHAAGPAGGATVQSSGSHLDHVSTSAYNFNCSTCHLGAGSGTIKHADYVIDVDINNTWGATASYSGDPAPGNAYGSCASTYCHSDGQGNYNNPTWGTTINTCTACHDDAAAGSSLSGAHSEHFNGATLQTIGKALGCVDCHTSTVSDNTTIADYSLHVNGGVDVMSCATNLCHSNGNIGNVVYNTPVFATDSYNCTTCHGNGIDQSYPSYADGRLLAANSNSHNAHVGGSNISCEQCHDDTSTAGTLIDGANPAQHVDGTIDVVFNPASNPSGAYNDGTDTCSTTYCHGATGTPVWGGAALNCNDCHSASSALADSHGVHYNSATVATAINTSNDSTSAKYIFQCGNCHNATTHAGGAVSVNQAAEVTLFGGGTYNAAVTQAGTDRGFDYTAGTCNTNACHNDGKGGVPNYNGAMLQWSVSSLGCTGCHNSNVASGTAMASGAHTKHINNSNHGASKTCQTCHDATLNASDTVIADKSVHVNGVVNVAILGALDGGNSAYAGSCDAVYCHSPGQNSTGGALGAGDYATATWATPSSGACGTCHKVTEALGLTSGSHAAHLGTTGVTGCANCHTGAANDASSYNNASHVNAKIDVANTYNSATVGSGNPGDGYFTCSAASCHNNGTGSVGVVESPRWGEPSTCASCHADDMTSASHGDHLTTTLTTAITISCDNCHGNAVKSVSGISGGLHFNDTLQVYNSAAGDLGYPNNVALGGAPYSSCSTTYCHGNTLKFSTEDMNDAVQNVDVSPTWGANLSGAGNGCDYCHAWPPVGNIGSGPQHPTSTDCSACHFHVTAVGDLSFSDPSKHIDGIVQVDGGNDCSDCHGAGKYKDPNLNHPDHAEHTDVYTFLAGKTLPGGDYGKEASGWYSVTYNASGQLVAGCGQCHPGSQVSHPSGGATEIDLDASGETITGSNAKKLNSTPSYALGQCNNVYCHSDGAGTFVASPTWDGTAGNGGITCASCHGNSPSTNAHGVHEVGIHYEELYDDDGVGLMAKSTRAADLTASGGTGAAHGNNATSSTISCFTCHSGTVTDSANAGNSTCASCHSDTNSTITGNEVARIAANSATHLNAVKNVSFADLSTFKSKAQLRDNLADANDGTNILSTIWNRIVGYKPTAGTGYDQVQATYNSQTFGSGSCSNIACHNGVTVAWNKQGNIVPATYAPDCMACHTSLPK